MISRAWLICVCVTALFSGNDRVTAEEFATARLHNWHQWRGPEANGVAPTGDPPIEWDQTRNIKWKAEIPGHGKSTPIIWKPMAATSTV